MNHFHKINWYTYIVVSLCFALFTLSLNTDVMAQNISLPPRSAAGWHPTDDLVAIGTFDSIAVFDDNLELVYVFPFDQEEVVGIDDIEWSPDGKMIAAAIFF